MMYDFYIGIDPGTDGAISILNSELEIVYCDNLPKTKNRRGSNILDVNKFIKVFLLCRGRTMCGLEDVWSTPSQGVKSAGSFMYAYGSIRTSLIFSKIPFIDIIPNEWKKHYGLKGGKGKTKDQLKAMSKELVIQIYPKDRNRFKLVKDHNKAESVLIARYCWDKSREIYLD